MNVTTLSLIVICVLNFSIGLYVLAHNPRRILNEAFAFFSVCVGVWSLAIVASTYPDNPSVSAFRIAFAVASLIPLGLSLIVESFPHAETLTMTARTRLLSLVALSFMVFSFSPYVVASGTKVNGELKLVYGPLHGLFSAYIVSAFACVGWRLLETYRASEGQMRLQLKHLAIAFLIPALLATITNVLVPFIFGSSRASAYGPLASLLMLMIIAHAIIRHRLMDVRVVIRRGAVYLAAFAVSGVVLLVLLVASSALVHDKHQAPLREIVLALVVAVFFHPLKGFIQRAFDRYLYREPYDYQRTIRQASRALSGTIELPVLLDHVGSIVNQTLRPEGQAVYLLDEEDRQFRRAAASGSIGFPDSLPADTPLLVMAAQERKPVFRDELGPAAAAAGADFARVGAEVVVPLVEDDQVIGLLAVGPKRSGDPYFSDDADLLGTLANQSAVAVRNAQAHQQVLEVNEHIQKILSTIESGVVAVSAKGRITLFNRAAELMTGAAAGALRGQLVQHLPAPLARLIAATLEDGQSRPQAEIALPDAAGQLVPLMCSTSPLWAPEGAGVGAVTVLSDLSRLKELEQEKRRAERLASLEAIASGMVHEIRNPLVAIKTFTQLLPVRFDEPSFRESFARVSDREITRIEDLLGRFRTLSSASSQPMEPVDVSAPLQATLELLRPQLGERQIQLRYVADGTPRPILGNASQLEQLFLNLCLNALEAMEPGGELTVRVADLCEAGGTTLLVEVSDTGPGIADNLLPKIFNPFVTTKARGSGLGLAICRSIADAHRATLRARNNTERRGSTFTIEFPVPTGRAARVPA